jgi:hypothetical protein
MDNLSCDMATSSNLEIDSMPQNQELSSVTSPPTDSAHGVHQFRTVPKSGQHPPDWVAAMLRNRWTPCSGFTGRHAPDYALQIADRFHLLKNLSDTVYKILQQEYTVIHQRLESDKKQPPIPQNHLDNLDGLTLSEQRRKKRIDQILAFHQRVWTQKAIAK